MIASFSESGAWPQMFITRVVGSEDLPDVEILTLPGYPMPRDIPDLEHLQLILSHSRDFETVVRPGIDRRGADAVRAALHQVIIDASEQQGLSGNPLRMERYAQELFSSYPVPIMNSPLSGSSLLQMAGSGAAFMARFPHPDVGHITLYFALIGATRIVLGAADGISTGLKQGLTHLTLKWMGIPQTAASARKVARPRHRNAPA